MEKTLELLNKIEVLPMSPTLLVKLLPALSDVDTNFDEVVEIIALDPALTSKLLQICNSAFFGMENPVSTVSEAVSQVGYQSVYLLVSMINGSNCFPSPPPPGVDVSRLWKHSLTAAFNAKFVADSAGEDGNLLFTAGLLHDVGKVVMGQAEPQQMTGYMHIPHTAAVAEREIALFGCTHAEVGGVLLERWKLPAQIIAAVRGHHDLNAASGFKPIAACVALGNFLSYAADYPKVVELDEFNDALDVLNLGPEHVSRWRDKLRDQQSLIDGMSKLPV